jgi:Cdc6-like AAA superfamily ATPase
LVNLLPSQTRILQFWRDTEIFDIPEPDKDAWMLSPDKPLPWTQNPPKKNPKYVWRYTLYFGQIEKNTITDAIDKLLDARPEEKPDWIEPATGKTCLAALIVDQQGRPDEKSYIQASYIHGMGCLARKESVSEVSAKLEKVQEEFEARYKIPRIDPVMPEGEGPRKGTALDWLLLQEEWTVLQELCQEAGISSPEDIYCMAKEVPPDSDPDTSFLNSFYLDDLNHLIGTDVNFGKAFLEFLAPQPDIAGRIDLITDKDALFRTIDPEMIPAGRWPSNIKYGLYTAQQAAVNTCLDELKSDGGIIGVNGPPGTGKTTLLLDVVAEIIVSRA